MNKRALHRRRRAILLSVKQRFLRFRRFCRRIGGRISAVVLNVFSAIRKIPHSSVWIAGACLLAVGTLAFLLLLPARTPKASSSDLPAMVQTPLPVVSALPSEQTDSGASSASSSIPVVTATPVRYEKGMSAPEIVKVQERLMDLGYMDSAEPTEYFGPYTKSAVMLFQRQHGLNQDGVLGAETLDLLNSPSAEKYTLKNGAKGDDVKEVQERLYQLGYLSEAKNVTGNYGNLTEEAVKNFQGRNGLTADGKTGEDTLEMLYQDTAKPNLLALGEQSDVVLKYQQRLQKLAYLTTTPDGKYGNDTLAAVRQFQTMNDLTVDGYLGPATRALLDSGKAQPNALAIGSSGATVTRVQQLLAQANCLKVTAADGHYGALTDAAVRLFQKTNGLSIDGKVGQKTMAKLTGGQATKAKSPVTSASLNPGSQGGQSTKPRPEGGTSVSHLISIARNKKGCTYKRGAKGPNSFDCSGFVYWCLKEAGVKQGYLTSYSWRSVGKYTKITNISDVRAGDVVVFHINGTGSTRGHVGLASDSTNMVHALPSGKGVVVETSFKQTYWKDRFICAWRIL